MVLNFLFDSPTYKQREAYLQLAGQHSQEWRSLLAREKEARSALETEHQAQMLRFRQTPDFSGQAQVVVRQLKELTLLKSEQKLVRDALRFRQAEEKAELDKTKH